MVKFKNALDASLAENNASKDDEDHVRAAPVGSGLDSPSGSSGTAAATTDAAASEGPSSSAAAAAAPNSSSDNVTQKWIELFDEAASAAGSAELNQAQFVVLARKALAETSSGSAGAGGDDGNSADNAPFAATGNITEEDLAKAFVLADADESGLVDRREFVQLMVLAQGGHVAGLSSSILNPLTWIKDGMFKAKLQAEKAAQQPSVAILAQAPSARAAAAAAPGTASDSGKVAATFAAGSSAPTGAGSSAPTGAAGAQQEEAAWRAHFAVAAQAAGRVVLSKSEFVKAALAAASGEAPPSSSSSSTPSSGTSSSGGSGPIRKNSSGINLFELDEADEDDWAKAFEVADADGSGYVDESEFVAVLKLNSQGHVRGLGGSPLNPLNWGQEGNFRASLGNAKMTAAASTAAPTSAPVAKETKGEK